MSGAVEQAPATVREAKPSDLEWIVERHRDLYGQERGWDERFGRLVAEVIDEFRRDRDRERERAWIAEVGGRRAGCVLCASESPEVAKLRLLLVEPEFRGLGVGSTLIETCVRFARECGYRRMRLWTNDVLTDAARLYHRAGFRIVHEERHAMFGPPMVGQTYELDLDPRPAP